MSDHHLEKYRNHPYFDRAEAEELRKWRATTTNMPNPRVSHEA